MHGLAIGFEQSLLNPLLPAAATTTIPAARAAATALVSVVRVCGPARDRLMISAPLAVAQVMAVATSERLAVFDPARNTFRGMTSH